MLLGGSQVAADGLIHGAQMADMTPTILALCGLEAASEFDGVTLRSIVSAKDRSPRARSQPNEKEKVYREEEEAEIASRLANLGYF
ncbi:MAG: hypothetical protein HY270_18660 [Deltaproteobacteria bacterium]|nr:hypothetical protein [Deltaproteobacteria bacterium]